MYLADLSNEEKELFLDLMIFSMISKGMTEEREETLAKRYCNEMEINYRTKCKSESCEEAARKLRDISTDNNLKKVMVDLVALMYADETFDNKEYEILQCLRKEFGFSAHVVEEIIFATRHLLLSLRMIEDVVR